MRKNLNKNIAVVDLFCGIGGLSHGFLKEKFEIKAGIDLDETCSYAYEKNNKADFICKSIKEISGKEINELFGNSQTRILVGCAPCQPFSSYTFKNKEEKKEGGKWSLLDDFSRIIEQTLPDIVSMENVPNLLHFKKAPIFNNFVEKLKKLGYKVSYKVVFCPDYGIPQIRKRLVLLASKLGEIELIPPTHSKNKYKTVRQTIGKLPSVEPGESHPHDKLHYASDLSDLNKKRIKATPYGGSWRDWPEELLLECHKKESGKSYGSVYGRMVWEEPAPTMTTQCIGLGNGRFGHPEQDRAISVREAALFQTFPKTYKFIDPKTTFSPRMISRHIGNAVPVRLGQIIARSIKKHLSS